MSARAVIARKARAAGAALRILCAIIAIVGLGACVRVRPQDREHLAHPAMQTPAWPSVDQADQHVFSIREGTVGATGTGGGGCGCN